MGFASSVFDVKKLARNLDRKPPLPDRGLAASFRRVADKTRALDLDSYIYDNVFVPIFSEGIVPIGHLDFDRIDDDVIDEVFNAFENCDFGMMKLCLTLESFPASASGKKIII